MRQITFTFLWPSIRVVIIIIAVCLFILMASGCSPAVATQVSQQVQRLFPSLVDMTPTPFQPLLPTPTPTLAPTLTPEPVRELTVWFDPAIPQALKDQILLPVDTKTSIDVENANLQIAAIRGDIPDQANWLYVLAAPFPTLANETSIDEIMRAWRGEPGDTFSGSLILSPQTHSAFEARWGPAGGGRIVEYPANEIVDRVWNSRSDWVILPFEDLNPRLKVLQIDGLSPLEPGFDLKDYPLSVWFGISGDPEALRLLSERLGGEINVFPSGNFDPQKMTTLAMTGVTALTRATGYRMDTIGTTYPGQDIRDWLLNADLAHISNEVSFNEECPNANPYTDSTLFCSKPEYIELLDYLGIDIIELSGNHNNDWGRAAFRFSLDLYQDRNWLIFAGGENIEKARQPARIEHNGNHLAFIGCNPVGPTGVWATADQPGAAACEDYEWMLNEIRQLREEGYLPIVTFQYYELYTSTPSERQKQDFRSAVDAGAVIVSGSQAHFPQIMEFYNDSFIHFGLGNLFFDQMDTPVNGTRREFIDWHIFYDGRHIQTVLLTALLEDYARPRPMNEEERRIFLTDIFETAGW